MGTLMIAAFDIAIEKTSGSLKIMTTLSLECEGSLACKKVCLLLLDCISNMRLRRRFQL